MVLDKSVRISMLNDFYGKLLTDKQQQILVDYYNNNISLGEIAGSLNISRQAVLDSLNKASKKLEDYEKKLGLLKKFEMQRTIIEELNKTTNSKEFEKILKVWEEM